MFKFDNTHIFTGYLKQLLSSVNLPTSRVYTRDFTRYFERHGKEDPRVIESFETITKDGKTTRTAVRVNYLKNNRLYNYFITDPLALDRDSCLWKSPSSIFYDKGNMIPGLTKTLKSPGGVYDAATHEYLGDYLRFMRDYYDINLMSMYNCFNNQICNNIYYPVNVKVVNPEYNKNLAESDTNTPYKDITRLFDSRDTMFRIYAFPVKLFADYTIAIDCNQEIELFCGFYKTALDTVAKSEALIEKTYQKVNRSFFNKPFLYDKLNVKYWGFDASLLSEDSITRWDIANREQDLKLFIKVPVSCKSSITVLEGDFRGFNDVRYTQSSADVWKYDQNHSVINFGDRADIKHGLDTNNSAFRPISKLQLLAINTGESYPFAERLVDYLSGSAITPIDDIADNVKRVQEVMSQNGHYFKIRGLWEDKMQKIVYDYIQNSGPVNVDSTGTLVDKRQGYHRSLGHTSKSNLYDVLGYVDKDAEQWYASWRKVKRDGDKYREAIHDSIQNVDIYKGLFDME